MARIKKQQRREAGGEWVKSVDRSKRWRRSSRADVAPWERALIGVRDADCASSRKRGVRLVHWLARQGSDVVREVQLLRALAAVPWPALRRDRLPDVPVSTGASLARLLLEKYPLPAVLRLGLSTAWCSPRAAALASHVGGGGGFREARRHGLLPVGTTRRVYNAFIEGPAIQPMARAWRVAQARSVGLPTEVGLLASDRGRLRRKNADEYWLGVFRWLVQQRVEPPVLGVIVEVLCHDPIPVAGRSVASLLRVARERMEQRGRHVVDGAPSATAPEFVTVRLPGLDRDDGWRIEQIVRPLRLWQEGRYLHHCVWTYRERVRTDRCTIWSLSHHRVPTLTIEVRGREIVQVRGYRNRPPSAHEREVLEAWQRALVGAER